MPNGLTLFNLMCGIFAIILAMRQQFSMAPGFIVLGGIADALDGRVARATGTGSRFGEELDSLTDAISFGFAPALILYIMNPVHGQWDWLFVFIFTACAVMRLARFNVEQAGRAKTHFHGLPSPAAGLTLATYYWFSQTPLYNQTVILFTDSKTLSDLPWHAILRGLMAVLAALMISDVPYPAFPSIGFRSIKRLMGTVLVVGSILLLIFRSGEFIFPALVAYVLYGVVKWMIIGLLGRSGTPDEIFWDRKADAQRDGPREERRAHFGRPAALPMPVSLDDDEDEDEDESEADEAPVSRHAPETRRGTPDERKPEGAGAQQRRRRRRRGGKGNRPRGSNPPGPPLPDTPSPSPNGPTE
ncbi:MAG TPA: CDP-diacylglycerol--serine O-phosphatidyltransferase [Gemmatimonadaceae bacterium]|jgi:CDP-diacylglycerol--serine O-phosphatidyltransferase|nr:CDP-diacylglycerol--serine O-phosphatidyltransferase [Gemmatimonadaceae bacterium]